MSSNPGDPSLEPIDWDQTGRRTRPSARITGVVVATAVLLAAFLYDFFAVPASETLVGQWDATGLDWMLLFSLVVLVFGIVVPLYQRRRRTMQYWRDLRKNRLAVASLAYLGLFFVVGLVGPVLVGTPDGVNAFSNPPFWASITERAVGGCLGEVSNGLCHGSLQEPFGTTSSGHSVFRLLITGTRTALSIALVTMVLIAPIATVVGTVAAFYGGTVDEVLMRFVDVVQSIPPFFVYIFLQFLYTPSTPLLIGVFGFLNWGSMARLVRSEALQKTEAEYVDAARSAGHGNLTIIRQHLVPNVSNTVLTAATLQMPTLIILEATLSFLGFGGILTHSWGMLMAIGTRNFPTVWWSATFPAIAIALTVGALNLLGDALRDVLDPRLEAR